MFKKIQSVTNIHMTVQNLIDSLSLTVLTAGDLNTEVTGCYCGDLLSWVMSRAEAGDAWLTVMGNINSVGVAVLADTACIILTENAALDKEAKKKAEENEVTILTTEKNSYKTATEIYELLKSEEI